MSSDIARGVIAKLRAENKALKDILRTLFTNCRVHYTKSNEPKRHTKNKRRA